MNYTRSIPGSQRRNSIELNDVVINEAGHVNVTHDSGEDGSLESHAYHENVNEPFVARKTADKLCGAKKDLFQHVSFHVTHTNRS